ncbi:MAG: putative secreted glycosyl hydrolase [Phycisphaerales bacterium]|nr:putative secreted glycosyl hydrolase [Phycisphaerales bacterium]
MAVARFGRVLVCALAVSAWAGYTRAEDAATAEKPKSVVPAIKDPHRSVQFAKDKEEALKKGEIQLVFLGDSITDGWRGGPQHEIFLKAFGKYNPYNTGISGDQTQHLLYRIDHGELDGIHPKVVEIMIGTNNLGNGQSPKDAIEGIKAVVEDVEKKLPETKILLLAVFPRGEKASDGFRPKIKEVNEALAKLPDADKHVKFLDINEKFLDSDGTLPKSVMPDSLHPNVKGYQIWADAIEPTVDEMEK